MMLGAASGLSPFGVTVVVPLLAVIAAELDASPGQAQFLISAYLFGLALAQPFNGYLCDRFGRRPVLIAGFTVFILAGFMAAQARSMEALIALRFLQAAGVSVGTVASRAVLRDTRDARGTLEALAYIAAFMGLAPVIGPIVGGWLGAAGGHPRVFTVTSLLGMLVLAWIWFGLPETLRPAHARTELGQWLRDYLRILRSGAFIGYTLIFGFVQGSFFAFLAVGALVFDAELGIGPRQFGLWWGLMALIYVSAALLSGRLSRSIEPRRVMDAGIVMACIGGVLAPALVLLHGVAVWTLLLPMALLMTTAGFTTPGALAGAVNLFPERAGSASGLSSSLGIVLGGMFTVLGGAVYDGHYPPVAWLIAASAGLTAASWLLVRVALARGPSRFDS